MGSSAVSPERQVTSHVHLGGHQRRRQSTRAERGLTQRRPLISHVGPPPGSSALPQDSQLRWHPAPPVVVVLTPDTRAWSRDLATEAARLAETRFTQQTTLISEWTGQKDRPEQTPRARSNNKHCKVHLQSKVTTHFSPVTSSRSSESSLSISLYIYVCVYIM